MKIHIAVAPEQETIEGFKRVEVIDGAFDLSDIADNECTFIMASDMLNAIPVEHVEGLVKFLRSKMRINGRLVIGGLDIRLLARNIVRGAVDTGMANNIIYGSRSCLDFNTTKNLLRSCGLTIDTSRILGDSYEIEATRS